MLVTLAGTKGSTIVVKDFKTRLIKINEILDTVCGRLTIVLRVKMDQFYLPELRGNGTL